MTDLPADPSAWIDEARAGAASAAAPEGAAVPEASESAVAGSALAGSAVAGSAVAGRVVYDEVAAAAPATGWRALLGPLVGVALVGVGLGFLLARTAGSSGVTASGRTVLTSPARPAPSTVAVLGATATNGAATTRPSSPPTAAPTGTTAPTAAAPGTSAAPGTTAPAPTTTALPTVTPAPAPTTAPAPTSAPPAPPAAPGEVAGLSLTAPVRWAEFSGGMVYLHGRIPDAQVGATIQRKAAAVVGEANVVQDYVIDPSAPAVAGGPLTVDDTVQFDPDSAVVRPAFGQILGLGALLLQQNPVATITVVGRADNRGPAGYNLQLSRQRATAVAAYLTAAGADPARVTVDARGANDPLADGDTAADRQANRSVEFIILGLLD